MELSMPLKNCRLCGSDNLKEVINLGELAFTGQFPSSELHDVPVAPLRVVRCLGECGLVQLDTNFDSAYLYGNNYGYRSSLNRSMQDHLYKIAAFCQSFLKLQPGDIVLDIGSNDGTFLKYFDVFNFKYHRYGVDPVEKFSDYYNQFKSITFINKFFSKEIFPYKARLITAIAMLYDLQDPLKFLSDVHEVLDDDGMFVFEVAYLPRMIDNTAYDSICHEHLEYYCPKSINWMLKKAGFTIFDFEVNEVNGGSILIYCVKGDLDKGAVLCEEDIDFEAFAERVYMSKLNLNSLLNKLLEDGKTVMALGASTKGNVLLQACGITRNQISMIGEVNWEKFGRFTPGTKIPIVPEQEVFESNPDYLLILPWHFKEVMRERYSKWKNKMLFPLPCVEVV